MAISIRLSSEIEARLAKLANRTGRSKTYYVREAILEHLDDMEALYIAEKELKAIRSGRAQTLSLEEVMNQYGMES
jgi:RHH-type rel operon transcriptional repressor/antitoxin RelB